MDTSIRSGMKIVDYQVVEDKYISALVKKVNSLISIGYIPCDTGLRLNLPVANKESLLNGSTFIQVMVKYENSI